MRSLLEWLNKFLLRDRSANRETAASLTANGVPGYPWYGLAEGDEIEQGDILERCPVFVPPKDLTLNAVTKESKAIFEWQEPDLIVISQSCDLAKGRENIQEILLCAVWERSELTGNLAKDEMMESARKGRLPTFHVLAASSLDGFEREVRVVDFGRVFSLPVPFVRARAMIGKRLRLLPPYREHLSQSFARFFMRVGLPIDIPPFEKKKK